MLDLNTFFWWLNNVIMPAWMVVLVISFAMACREIVKYQRAKEKACNDEYNSWFTQV